MKPFLSLFVLAALLLTTTPSEARSRGRRDSVSRSSDDSGGYVGGGGMTRDRGISIAESAAIGSIIQEIANSPAPKIDPTGAPQRKHSADYYRIYAKQRAVVYVKSGKPVRAVFRPQAKR